MQSAFELRLLPDVGLAITILVLIILGAERLVQHKELLDLDLHLGGSLPPEPDWWRLAINRDLEAEEGILISWIS